MSISSLAATEEVITERMSQEWDTRHAFTSYRFGALGVLAGEELVSQIQSSDEHERDRLLGVLLTMSTRDRDDVALRVLVQAFTPLIHAFARRLGGNFNVGGSNKATTNLNASLAVFWEVVCNFPLHRTQHLSGNIRGEMNKIISREFTNPYEHELALGGAQEITETALAINRGNQQHNVDVTDSIGMNVDSMNELMRVLDWAIEQRVLKAPSAKLLGAYTVATKAERHQMAAELETSSLQLSKRISGYAQRLAKAVQTGGLCREELSL